MIKRLLLAFGLALCLGPAVAQVNFVPQVGINSANLRQNTYSASILKLVPVASATDFFCINGSATKSVHINRIELSGTAGTLVTTPIYLNHNTVLDTGTRAVAATYGPVPYPLGSAMPAATATVIAYNSTGGNPTIGGTATTVRSGTIMLPLSGTTTSNDRLVWTFGTSSEFYNARLTIPALATPVEQFCLNLAGVSVSSGVLEGYIEWVEY